MNDSHFIATNDRARAIFIQGRELGYGHGYANGHRDAGDAAEAAGRAFVALEATEAHTRAFAKSAADALTVPRFRERPQPVLTIKPTPTLAQFLEGLRRGGVLTDRQEVAAA